MKEEIIILIQKNKNIKTPQTNFCQILHYFYSGTVVV